MKNGVEALMGFWVKKVVYKTPMLYDQHYMSTGSIPSAPMAVFLTPAA